ncbi:hypothetical protein PPL_10177 [Heterostelium album PN500]|uniref:N-acetyl-D-glucosamine kinase n=1 Tax=Heterostelium pallidum (strain ATCC 26659 / Pp 5 / PN500) TaxID=670386 RepID=D3BQJ2_HETP5|nr:hypothetical protein PPL_10177 [Heterostelium album PN500]EFA76412.1 hypothetical protein PPL_10177 [Heterostelium album PN500]|eukprot:XP_020428544.1 hypothetical protein PPL_10177 [Heterostelium album PN500]
MKKQQLFVGLDGGGTKTLSVVVDSDGNELGKFVSTCSNYHSVGEEAAKRAIYESISEAVKKSGGSLEDVVEICLGISGVDRPEDIELVGGWIRSLLPNAQYKIFNDAVVALTSGTMGKLFGVVVISGTGCISFGIDHHGNKTRSAGWGPALGDDGSGYQIGFDVLKYVCMAKDETNDKTLLTQALLDKLQVTKEEQLITWAYDPKNQGWHRVAELAPLATECALKGDKVAISILDHHSSALVKFIKSVFTKLNLLNEKEVPLVLAGGNIERDCIFSDKLKEKLAKELPNAVPVYPKCTAGMGAALLALNTFKENKKE